ncbi:hypothetical protein HN51_066226 [Arachis hypogaea]
MRASQIMARLQPKKIFYKFLRRINLKHSSSDYKATDRQKSEKQIHCTITIKTNRDENAIHLKVNQTKIETTFYKSAR